MVIGEVPLWKTKNLIKITYTTQSSLCVLYQRQRKGETILHIAQKWRFSKPAGLLGRLYRNHWVIYQHAAQQRNCDILDKSLLNISFGTCI